jgi:peptidoglycan hydrolase-like protein with peptidoglycan-binding domain
MSRRRGALRSSAWLVAAVLVLVACGAESGESDVEVAAARVTQKEKALTDARSDASEATTAACRASQTYVVALDRYGDVLAATAPTVGDVKTAGTDLGQPREDALAAADTAVDAQEAVAVAEQELADARAALKVAKGKTPSASPSGTAAPVQLAPGATVNRVKQAESDFRTAQEGITDETPLVRASQQFNAAAVALEMAWLQLFADAGCIPDAQEEQAADAVHDYTATLQGALAEAGYYDGKIDGVYGPSTVDAVEALQEANGLPVTGTVDKATDAALRAKLEAKGGAAAEKSVVATVAVQQTLRLAGFWDGPVDGEWTPALTEALMAFQTELGVTPTGTVDAATVAALEKAIAKAGKPEPASPSPTASDTGPSPSGTGSADATTSTSG